MAEVSPYDVLLERILMGEYAPGSALVEKDLAKEFGVSRTPVREALHRLKLENLVRIIPRGGTFIEESSIHTIRDVTEVRLVLEEYVLRLAVERGQPEAIEDLVRWVKDVRQGWDGLSQRDRLRVDDEFHAWLYRLSGNRALGHHLSLLRRQSVLFWGQLGEQYNSLEGIHRDFDAIAAALANQDVDACVVAIRRHVLADIERITTYLKPKPATDITEFSGPAHAGAVQGFVARTVSQE